MHIQQPKTHDPDTALAQPAEPSQKAVVSAASAKRVPAWAGGMNDQIPTRLVLEDANTIPGMQAKLAISQPNDPYEQEADRVAEHVMRMPASSATVQRKCACGGIAGPTGECEACALKRKTLQRRATQSATESTAPPAVNQVLSSGNGQPLDVGIRAFMEPRFGTDFSQVRVHTDGQAAESAQSVNALAYTVGSDVVFGQGQYRPETGEGQKLLVHELTHVVQQNAVEANFGPLMLQRQQAPTAPCTVGDPGNCPTYEEWIHAFSKLPTFPASDRAPGSTINSGFEVLGDEPAREVRPGNDPAPEPSRKLPPPPAKSERNYEHFIDHPTDAWVTNNLPPELRETAYLLPVDCADLAAVLRHVWLFYHKRTERYGKWVLGLGVSHADINKLIVWDLSAYNVNKMVNMYSDAGGRPVLSFDALKKLLHPGDILVWEHHKSAPNGPLTGGHTQTVENVVRDDQGNITSLTLLQGNEPIFRAQAEAIKKKLGASVPDVHTMRDAPGRRIERATLSDPRNLHDEGAVWTHITETVDDRGKPVKEFTILVAAGPPASAIRPAAGKSLGTLGQLSDWLPLLRKATQGNLEAIFEASLQATRAMIEGGQQVVTEQDAVTLGSIVGERLRMLGRLSQAGHGGHFDALKTLQHLHAVVRALGGLGLAIASGVQVQDTTLKRIFERIDVALESVEETRLIPSLSSPFGTTTAPGQIIMGAGFGQLMKPFGTALNAASTLVVAQTVVRDFGQKLWQLATTRAQAGTSPNTDDRPLYWTRLLMMHALRMWQPGFPIDFGQRQDLLDLFERASRGMESVSFSGTGGVKKILISGFDPFGLDANINTGNPSGAAALALNGRPITGGGIKAEIRGVIFPVRFADFDERKIETFFSPYLTGPDRVDMIMTISQGGREFEVEEWAGRRRSSGSFADNAGRIGGGSPKAPVVPPGLGRGPEFIRTALPEQEIRAELGRTQPIAEETEFKDIPGKHTDGSQKDPTKRHSTAVEGSGGGFLSNEIFYRTSLLRLQTHATIPVGHLHVPIVDTQSGLPGASKPWTRDAIVNQVQRILEATLPKL